MNLTDIRTKAELEHQHLQRIRGEVERVRQLGVKNPQGTIFHLAPALISTVERICDAEDIPFYHIGEGSCSTALNYFNLHQHEARRCES